jgi:hypothetical protein
MLVTAVASNTFTVTRGAESTTATSHSSGAQVTHVVTAGAINQSIADNCQQGTYASLPAAEKAGRSYLTSDGPFLLRDGGSTWNPFGPIWKLSPPVDSNFSWMNQGSSTTTTNGGVYLDCQSNGAVDSIRGRYTATPATPYTITIGFHSLQRGDANAVGVSFLFLLESGTGKMCSIAYGGAPFNISGAFIPNAGQIRTFNHTGPTNFTTRNNYNFSYLSPIWMRFVNNGTNIVSYVGCTPFNFIQVDSQLKGDPFTTAADSYGYALDPFNNEAGMYVFHLSTS